MIYAICYQETGEDGCVTGATEAEAMANVPEEWSFRHFQQPDTRPDRCYYCGEYCGGEC
jgi:hypothetical protein